MLQIRPATQPALLTAALAAVAHWPRRRLGPIGWQYALFAAAVILPLLRFATYRAWADGSFDLYARRVALGVCCAALTWLFVRLQVDRRAVLPWVAALVVLAPGDGVHYLRLTRTPDLAVQQSFVDDFAAESASGRLSPDRWLVEQRPGTSVAVANGWVRIENEPGAAGWVDVRWTIPTPSIERRLSAPQPVYGRPYDLTTEVVEWDAQVHVQNQFYVILDTGNLLLQATPSGLHVTYPGANGVTEYLVDTPVTSDGRPHHFRLERTDGLVRLQLDGYGVWVEPDAGNWQLTRFGDSRSDANHGGTLLLGNVRYVRHFQAHA